MFDLDLNGDGIVSIIGLMLCINLYLLTFPSIFLIIVLGSIIEFSAAVGFLLWFAIAAMGSYFQAVGSH